MNFLLCRTSHADTCDWVHGTSKRPTLCRKASQGTSRMVIGHIRFAHCWVMQPSPSCRPQANPIQHRRFFKTLDLSNTQYQISENLYKCFWGREGGEGIKDMDAHESAQSWSGSLLTLTALALVKVAHSFAEVSMQIGFGLYFPSRSSWLDVRAWCSFCS